MSSFFRLAYVLCAVVIAGCASDRPDTSAADTARDGPFIVLTAKNMNAHSSSIPALNQKMGEEVSSVATLVKEKLERSGRKVVRKSFEQASSQDIARAIKEEQLRPARLIQIYWSATEGGDVLLNVTSLPIIYGGSGAKFGGDSGRTFKILGPGTYTTRTAEEIAEEFVRSQQP